LSSIVDLHVNEDRSNEARLRLGERTGHFAAGGAKDGTSNWGTGIATRVGISSVLPVSANSRSDAIALALSLNLLIAECLPCSTISTRASWK
jgi:hypothetical protein